ncbi:hypothetical protein SADFL11_00046410 [Roseibium alexandrii DFL-11]|uniref:Uncharacterized protein n=1 Tax=Roseibium alexandrii (strain DSM 17067 / NCIMB 14079 / DFL-11) TaxID=244592 RepID=A0A5E8UWZ9_ROSAD|nr:hypothetical protein SADFL11_00046410 [Roseibium alexandrii DFL-11]
MNRFRRTLRQNPPHLKKNPKETAASQPLGTVWGGTTLIVHEQMWVCLLRLARQDNVRLA